MHTLANNDDQEEIQLLWCTLSAKTTRSCTPDKDLIFYPGIENLSLPMLSYAGCHVRATYTGCTGTHAHGRQVTPLLC